MISIWKCRDDVWRVGVDEQRHMYTLLIVERVINTATFLSKVSLRNNGPTREVNDAKGRSSVEGHTIYNTIAGHGSSLKSQ